MRNKSLIGLALMIIMFAMPVGANVVKNIPVQVSIINVPPTVNAVNLNYLSQGTAVIPGQYYSLTASISDANGISDIAEYKVILIRTNTTPTLSQVENLTPDGKTSAEFIITPDGKVTPLVTGNGWNISIISLPNSGSSYFAVDVMFGTTALSGNDWYAVVIAVDKEGATGFGYFGPFPLQSLISVATVNMPMFLKPVKLTVNKTITIPLQLTIGANEQVSVKMSMSDLTGMIYDRILYNGEDFTATVDYNGTKINLTTTPTQVATVKAGFYGVMKLPVTIKVNTEPKSDIYSGTITIYIEKASTS